jgi:hypothetical protein
LLTKVEPDLDRDAYVAERSRRTKATIAALKPEASNESEVDSEVVEEDKQHQNNTKRV